MLYRINEITREKISGDTFVLVDFWQTRADFEASRPAYLTNDHVMSLSDAPSPADEIDRNIRAYWREAVAHEWRGNHTADTAKPLYQKDIRVRQRATPGLQRDTTDNGVIKRQDVQDLVGVGTERE